MEPARLNVLCDHVAEARGSFAALCSGHPKIGLSVDNNTNRRQGKPVNPSLIVGVFMLSVFGTGSDNAVAQSKTEQELIQIENDWCTAEVKRDAAIYGRILADDYAGVGSRGTTETKAEAMGSLKDMSASVGACVNSNMKVRVYGDAAVVTGLVTRSGTHKGAAYKDRQVLFTDMYVRRDGRWQCVASGGTLVAAQQK